MKKIFGLTVTVLLIIVLLVGGTWAYFSDIETSTGNTWMAGTLNMLSVISGSGTGSTVTEQADGLNDKVVFSLISPGSSGTITWTLSNTGNVSGTLTMAATTTFDENGTSTEPELVAESALGGVKGLDTGVMVWVTSDGTDILGTTGTYVAMSGLATALNLENQSIAAGGSLVYILHWQIPTTVGNEIQGDTAMLNITFNTLQVNSYSFLGSADNFVVLAGAGITNIGSTTITGDVGTYSTISETGFETVILIGTNYAGDAVTQQAKTELTAAYTYYTGQSPITRVPTELGGTTKTPGVYDSAAGTFGITGTLTLDAGGNPSAIFIFKMASTLTTATSSQIDLIGGAKAANVYWVVGSSATLESNSSFKGNILAVESITLNNGVVLEGRALASIGAVTLNANIIIKPAP